MEIELIDAVKKHDELRVRNLLSFGVNPNFRNPNGNTALMFAASQGSHELVQMLLSHRADPNIPNKQGNTPLITAVERNHMNIALLLLNHGANAAHANGNGTTPLMFASRNNALPIARTLVERGAGVNAANHKGHTVLMLSCIDGHQDMVTFLLESGAHVHKKDNNGYTALLHAVRPNHYGIVELLLKHEAKPEEANIFGVNAVTKAAEINDERIMTALLYSLYSRKVSISYRNAYQTAKEKHPESSIRLWLNMLTNGNVHSSEAGRFNKSIVKDIRLIRIFSKYDLKLDDESLFPFISISIQKKDRKLFDRFFPSQPNSALCRQCFESLPLNEIEPYMAQRLLWLAFVSKHPDLACRLFDHQVPPHTCRTKDKEQHTMDLAISLKDQSIIELLLDRGVIPSKHHLEQAIINRLTYAVRLMVARGADVSDGSQLFAAAIGTKQTEMVQLLIELDIDPDQGSRSWQAPLLKAISSGMDSVAEYFIVHGKQLQELDKALLEAVARKNEKLALLLLDHGADAQTKNVLGQTAFQLATENRMMTWVEKWLQKKPEQKQINEAFLTSLQKNQSDLAVLFLQYGADPHIKLKNGQDAFSAAVERQMVPAAEKLMSFVDNQEIYHAFMNSVRNNALPIVRMFIRKGIGPNVVDGEGTSALMHAVKAGHSNMVYELILAGANTERQNQRGETARSAALAGNQAGMLRILSSKPNLSGESSHSLMGTLLSSVFGRSKPRERFTHCWSCKTSIDSVRYLICSSCHWIICPCSACGCTYSYGTSYRNY
ncbi:ankyrin repeat domain-containing protein [Paenibacillus naphthalenovorans]|uniref:ankyrin repeat domain-containing protein n=1 Tax=Paenibacillus naphthalenovorans TaxID=162209 RepID=UPI003D2DACD2